MYPYKLVQEYTSHKHTNLRTLKKAAVKVVPAPSYFINKYSSVQNCVTNNPFFVIHLIDFVLIDTTFKRILPSKRERNAEVILALVC